MTNGTLLARKCSNSHLTSLTNFEGWKVKLTLADTFSHLVSGQAFPLPAQDRLKGGLMVKGCHILQAYGPCNPSAFFRPLNLISTESQQRKREIFRSTCLI